MVTSERDRKRAQEGVAAELARHAPKMIEALALKGYLVRVQAWPGRWLIQVNPFPRDYPGDGCIEAKTAPALWRLIHAVERAQFPGPDGEWLTFPEGAIRRQS